MDVVVHTLVELFPRDDIGVCQPMLKRVLKSLEAEGKVRCARPGQGAIWEKLDNNSDN